MRTFSHLSLLLILVTIFTGCKVGPNYCGPPATAVASSDWTEPESEDISATPTDLCRWWETFNDPILDQLVGTAVSNSPTLRQAAYRIVQARAQLGTTRADLFPQIDTDGSFYHSKQSAATPIPGIPLVRDSWSWGLNANWEVDVFGRLRRLVEASEADICVTVEDYRNTMIILMADVAQNYVDARSYQQRIAVTKKNIAIQYETLKLAEKKKEIGTGATALDVAQARANYKSTESDLPRVELGYRQAVNRLSVLLGMPPGSVDEMMSLSREDLVAEEPVGADGQPVNQSRLAQILATPLKRVIPVPPEQVAVGIPADLLRRRPDIRAVERRIAGQNARIGAALGLMYPMFSITGTFGLDARDFSKLFTAGAVNAGVGPSLRWNILNFGKYRCNVAVQRAATEELIALYQNTVLQAAEEVDDAIATYIREKERTEKLREAVAAYKEAADLSWKMYIIGSGGQEGKVDVFQRMLDSQRALLIAQDQLVVAEATVTNSVIFLYRAMGGGWWCPPGAENVAATPVRVLDDSVMPEGEGTEIIIEQQDGTIPPAPDAEYPTLRRVGGPIPPEEKSLPDSEQSPPADEVALDTDSNENGIRNRLIRLTRSPPEPTVQIESSQAVISDIDYPRMIQPTSYIAP